MVKSLILISLWLGPIVSWAAPSTQEAKAECAILSTAMRALNEKITSTLRFPLVSYRFQTQSPVPLELHCEKLSREERRYVFLLLADIEVAWHIAGQEQGHPSLVHRAREAFENSIRLMKFVKIHPELNAILTEVQAQLRLESMFRLPGSAETDLYVLLSGEPAAGLHELLDSLTQDVDWLESVFRTEYPQQAEDASRLINARGAHVILRLAHLGELQAETLTEAQRRQVDRLLARIIDAVYGERVEREFLVPRGRGHLRAFERHGVRHAFLKNVADPSTPSHHLRGVPSGPFELGSRLDRILPGLLRKLNRERAAALVQGQLWSLTFLWNPSHQYRRSDQPGLARPYIAASLEPLIAFYFELNPVYADPELLKLAGALSALGGDAWPAFDGLEVTPPDAEFHKLSGHIMDLLRRYDRDKTPVAWDQEDIRDDARKSAFASLERERFRLHGMNADVRIENFKKRYSRCEGGLGGGSNIVYFRP